MAKRSIRALAALLLLAPAWLLAAPRVITLSPANTELAFAAGITPVGVSSFSDYPPQAAGIEQVATWQGMNLERIVALKPDLVLAWRGGNAERQVNQLTSLGIKVMWVDAVSIEQVAQALRALAPYSPAPQKAESAANQMLSDDRCIVRDLRLREGEEGLNDLRRKVRQDLCHFEGNAQGIRLVHSLMRMNLTWAQVGCILKYTRPAWWMGVTPASHSYLMKKPGYYLSEEAYIERLRKELSLTPNGRFPLTWIMEAADDISYCVADLPHPTDKAVV